MRCLQSSRMKRVGWGGRGKTIFSFSFFLLPGLALRYSEIYDKDLVAVNFELYKLTLSLLNFTFPPTLPPNTLPPPPPLSLNTPHPFFLNPSKHFTLLPPLILSTFHVSHLSFFLLPPRRGRDVSCPPPKMPKVSLYLRNGVIQFQVSICLGLMFRFIKGAYFLFSVP